MSQIAENHIIEYLLFSFFFEPLVQTNEVLLYQTTNLILFLQRWHCVAEIYLNLRKFTRESTLKFYAN